MLFFFLVFFCQASNEGFSNAKANIDPPYGVYNWSETEVGMSDTNVCIYNTAEELGIARRCANPGQWDVYYGGQCITRNSFLIQTLIEVSMKTFGVHHRNSGQV